MEPGNPGAETRRHGGYKTRNGETLRQAPTFAKFSFGGQAEQAVNRGETGRRRT
jgi:hypothetical protein